MKYLLVVCLVFTGCVTKASYSRQQTNIIAENSTNTRKIAMVVQEKFPEDMSIIPIISDMRANEVRAADLRESDPAIISSAHIQKGVDLLGMLGTGGGPLAGVAGLLYAFLQKKKLHGLLDEALGTPPEKATDFKRSKGLKV